MKTGFVMGFPRQEPLLSVGDLSNWLRPLTLARRRAIIFACELDIDLDTTVLLDWQTGGRLVADRKGLGAAIFRAQPRHLHLPYVFWEDREEGQAAPLFGLDRQVRLFAPDFPAFRRRYRGMALYDGAVEKTAFLAAFAGAA
jgi:hypothetical protein